MTHAKKLKKAIRARAAKTGESYTAARRHILVGRGNGQAKPAKSHSRSIVSDASVRKATGRGLKEWFDVLDAFEATKKGHTASAAHLNEVHGVRGWHSQIITVAYERARGLRTTNQSCAGDFQVGVSRAVKAGRDEIVSELCGSRWIAGVDPELARAYPKSPAFKVGISGAAKLRYKWGGSTIEIRISPKKGGATVVADSMKLASAADVEPRRAQWTRALEHLRSLFKK